MTTGDGFILVYSVVDEKSFAEVSAIHSRLIMLHEGLKTSGLFQFFPNSFLATGVLVGNKCDLVNDIVVSESSGRMLADSMKWGFLIASAKAKINVLDTFQEVSPFGSCH